MNRAPPLVFLCQFLTEDENGRDRGRSAGRLSCGEEVMPPRLKVFTWSDGFHSHPVAVSSRAKALAAWGAGQDLFKSGFAREVTSGPDYDAALASPGQVMRRGEAIDMGKVTRDAPPAKRTGPTKAQIGKVKALESELEALDGARQTQMATLERKHEALERDMRRAEERHARARDALKRRLATARKRLGE